MMTWIEGCSMIELMNGPPVSTLHPGESHYNWTHVYLLTLDGELLHRITSSIPTAIPASIWPESSSARRLDSIWIA